MMKIYRNEKDNSAELLEALNKCDTISYNRRKNTFTFYAHEGVILEDVENIDNMDLVKLANALDKRYFFEATIGRSNWNWDDEEEEDEQQEEPKTEEPKTEEPQQEGKNMRFKKVYFAATTKKIDKYNAIRFDSDIEFDVTNCTEAQEPDAIRKAVEKFVDELKKRGGAEILVDSLEMSLRFDEIGPECTFNEIRNGGNAFEIEINRYDDKSMSIYLRICEHQEAPTEEATKDDTHEETAVNQEVETMNETTTTTTTTTAAVKATTTSILSIWYGNLEAYNNGALRGQWIDFEEMDRDEIEEVMNKISRNGRDECMIFDYESRCGIDVGEYASIEELFEIYEICENIIDKYGDECGEYAIETFCEFYGAKYLNDIEKYDFYFFSNCYSMTDVAYEVVEECGYLDEMPENLRSYFDYEKFGRDLDIEGHFYDCGNGTYCEMVG